MNEMHYQLDLLKAMNQKLSAKEKMYRLVCDTTSSAFLHYSFQKNEITLLGRWDSYFPFKIANIKEIVKFFDVVEEQYILPLRDILFLEKTGKEEEQLECRRKDGKTWLVFDTIVICDDNGQPADKVICITDISKYKQQNDKLNNMAYYDSLTGLCNRDYFIRLLERMLRRAEDENVAVSVLIFDIDDFRKINDGLGIVIGDELVRQFGLVLGEFRNENTLVGRFGSDVFGMAIYDPVGSRSVEHIHKVIQNRIKEPFSLSGRKEINITVSVGVAEYPGVAQTAPELINSAEIVMFKGKSQGRNTIKYFDAPILMEFMQNIEIENKLKEAVNNKQFQLYYQPQFYAGNRKLRGVEALLRIPEIEGSSISPGAFIPIAEKNGSIVSIGKWVMEESIKQHSKWKSKYGHSLIMSINISAVQYQKADFADTLMYLLGKYHVEPGEIELEITEGMLIEDYQEGSRKLTALRDAGIRVALDDFGTGYSSLSYLKKLPIDTLKIDKSFIDTVLTDQASRVIMEAIIQMVTTLGFVTIAEGIEDEKQYHYLHAIGCDIIQGYYLGKPMPADKLESSLLL